MPQPVKLLPEFVGGNVSREVKDALRDEAAKRGISVSRLIYEQLLRDLRSLGHDLEDPTR